MDMCTAQGHVVGMLDRDQRTAKIHVFDKHVVLSVRDCERSQDCVVLTRRNKTISHRSVLGRTSPHSSCKTRKNVHFWKSLHRLKHALIVGAYLSLVTFPSILSAPTIRKSMSSREDFEHRWLNPCSMSAVVNGAPASGQPIPNQRLLDGIITQAGIAQRKANAFQKDYVEKTFNTDFDSHHKFYKDMDYDWLPTKKLPKKLGQIVSPQHLEDLELQPTLLQVYGYLQQIAVGLEQVVWDERDRDGAFKAAFTETISNLFSVLCEIQVAIIENNLTIENNVMRDIMGPEFRNMDNTSMNIRNWIIYRDYLNMLEYIIEVFTHFKTKLPTVG